jgi:hypothetical protein
VKAFREPFERGAAGQDLDVRFDFLFTLPDNLRRVTIHMLSSRDESGDVWVFISPIEG